MTPCTHKPFSNIFRAVHISLIYLFPNTLCWTIKVFYFSVVCNSVTMNIHYEFMFRRVPPSPFLLKKHNCISFLSTAYKGITRIQYTDFLCFFIEEIVNSKKNVNLKRINILLVHQLII